MGFRAFVAVPVPPAPPLVELLDELARLDADVKPVEAAQLHFTLSFLGQVEDEAQATIKEALDQATKGSPAFQVDLRHVGAFPSARRPRVAWVGVADPKPLSALATRVRDALAARELPQDAKDFRAHLTLARVRSERHVEDLVRFLQRHGQDELGTLDVREVVLYRSKLGPKGPAYDALERAPLEA